MAFQNVLQLSYVDKLLTDIQLEFRDKYKEDLEAGTIRSFEFKEEFSRILRDAELASRVEAKAGRKMRTFEESKKSQKTVESLKIDSNKEKNNKTKKSSAKSKEKTTEPEEGETFRLPELTFWIPSI